MIAPADSAARKSIAPVISYPVDTLPAPNMALYEAARTTLTKVSRLLPPRAKPQHFTCPRGIFSALFRLKDRKLVI